MAGLSLMLNHKKLLGVHLRRPLKTGNHLACPSVVNTTNDERFEIGLREQPEGLNFATYSPDGDKVVTASYHGKIKVWDRKTASVLSEPRVSRREYCFGGQCSTHKVIASWSRARMAIQLFATRD
jgi:WD40 repeat protein